MTDRQDRLPARQSPSTSRRNESGGRAGHESRAPTAASPVPQSSRSGRVALRDLHPQIVGGGARTGVQFPRRPTRGLRILHPKPEARRLAGAAATLRRSRLLRRQHGAAGAQTPARRYCGQEGRCGGRLQGRPSDPLARRLRQDRRGFRRQRRLVRLDHPGLQHDNVDGTADAQRAALVRPVRARGHGRAHPRQDRRFEEEGPVDGRPAVARLRRQGQETRRQRGGSRNGPNDLPAIPGPRVRSAN